MQIKIKGLPQQPQQIREKSLPEISKQIIKTLNASSNSDVKAITVIKDKFNGVDNNIPVNICYLDSNGDMVKISKFPDGRSLVEIEPCEKTLEYEALLYENNGSDDEKTSTGITRKRIVIDPNSIELCKVTLGFYRNYLQNLGIKGERKTHQDANNKTVYETVVKCKSDEIEYLTNLIKSFKKPNMIIEWYTN